MPADNGRFGASGGVAQCGESAVDKTVRPSLDKADNVRIP